MDFRQLREAVIVALFADDVLFELLVLKGGNALNIVHKLGTRASMDVDFSIEKDFEDLPDVERRIRESLEKGLDEAGFMVFDFEFSAKPDSERRAGKWGGYTVQFKVIERTKAEDLKRELEAMRRNAFVLGPGQQRVLRIEISKFEHTTPKEEAELDAYTIYVYSPAMIAVEKVRAICQQMAEYTKGSRINNLNSSI
jgi:predicted nucleotidyltransferase component of viral defense system